jgi:hypothetical protein
MLGKAVVSSFEDVPKYEKGKPSSIFTPGPQLPAGGGNIFALAAADNDSEMLA